MRGGRIFMTCLLGGLLWPVPAVRSCPTEPTDSWVYPYLYELRLRENTGRLFISTGPYGRLDIASWLKQAEPAQGGTREAWLYDMLQEDFTPESVVLETGSGCAGGLRAEARAETDSKVLGEGIGRFAYYSPSGLCFWTSLRASVNGEDLHKSETREWKDGIRAGVDYAGLAFRRKGFFISLARDEVSWGADRRRGLLFSGSAPVFDMLSIGYRTRRLSFTSFHSRLRGSGDEGPDDGLRRYVAAHRLEFLPTDLVSFSVSEAVLYGGYYRNFEPVYLNPLTIFYADQWNSGLNDNILIAGDFSFLFPRRAEVRGELMIDDFQYDFETEPNEFGAGISVRAINPLYPGTSLIGASYYYVSNQTYGHYIEWNRFVQEGRVMGYPDGPDGDRVEMWLTLAAPEAFTWKADYSVKRKGEGSADDVQEQAGTRTAFPSGVVETTHLAAIEVEWRPSHNWLFGAEVRYHHIRNAAHREGRDRDGWGFALSAGTDLGLNTLLGD